MREVEIFVGPCSKYIDKQGWTTEIPVSQIEEKGYHKLIGDEIVLSKEECAKCARLTVEKINKDSVILTKKEYDDLIESKRQLGCYIEDQKILLQRINSPDPFWFCSYGGCEGACETCRDDCEMSIFVQMRKEMVERILKEVKLKAWATNEDENGKVWNYSITNSTLNEIAQQYDVEVE
jgi:hypothetical protein